MKDYFQNPNIYEEEVKEEMKKLGVTWIDILLVNKDYIWNNYEKRRNPKDVALDLR